MRALDLDVRELRLTGGGAKSAPWRRILADVFAADVVTTTSTEGPAFGAAILAGVGAKIWSSVEEGADALVRVIDRTSPDAKASAEYAEIHAQFRALYGDLRARFRELRG
jgi:xylulokinase